MLLRKLFKNQCLFIPIFIVIMLSASFYLNNNNVYYVKTTVKPTQPYYSITPFKHVTKSLAELGKMDEMNKYILFLNQIPNCGGEVLIFLLQKLQGVNNYRHVRLKGGAKRLNNIQQEQFVDNLYEIMKKEAIPLSFDRQLYFTNFTTFDKQSPTYINIIRDPIDKAISRSSHNSKKGNKPDIVQCIIHQKRTNCGDQKIKFTELTIPYFCGHHHKCLNDRKWALQMAKNNVEKYYPVVGVLEELNTSLAILEHQIPFFFKGVQKMYRETVINKFKERKKQRPLLEIQQKRLKRALDLEYEFYNWIKERLFKQMQIAFR